MEVRIIRLYVTPVICNAYNSGKKIKVFICGDYEFETRSYGISGASGNKFIIASHTKKDQTLIGRHCCLWCHISGVELALPPSTRGPVRPRTTATLESDLESFTKDGSNIKRAKLFNNVIRKPLFPIPLDQAR